MNKVTKKELVEKANEHELRIFRIEQALKQSGIEWVTTEPKLKQLDQSAFDHEFVTDIYNYLALNANGQSIFFSDKPKVNLELGIWYTTAGSTMPMLKGYDTTDWQNSLIEREKVELTGSDLCRAMLERGDKYVMCANQSAYDDWPRAIALNERGRMYYISGEYSYDANDSIYPINNQGEPLTQSEAGL